MWSRLFWEGVNNFIPKVTVKPNKRHPWITKNIITLINKKMKLFKTLNGNPNSAENFANYKAACKIPLTECITAQEQYLWNLGRGKNGQQKLWKHIHNQMVNPIFVIHLLTMKLLRQRCCLICLLRRSKVISIMILLTTTSCLDQITK
jgi:hypothetical protein